MLSNSALDAPLVGDANQFNGLWIAPRAALQNSLKKAALGRQRQIAHSELRVLLDNPRVAARRAGRCAEVALAINAAEDGAA
jgi:hypothetical protein